MSSSRDYDEVDLGSEPSDLSARLSAFISGEVWDLEEEKETDVARARLQEMADDIVEEYSGDDLSTEELDTLGEVTSEMQNAEDIDVLAKVIEAWYTKVNPKLQKILEGAMYRTAAVFFPAQFIDAMRTRMQTSGDGFGLIRQFMGIVEKEGAKGVSQLYTSGLITNVKRSFVRELARVTAQVALQTAGIAKDSYLTPFAMAAVDVTVNPLERLKVMQMVFPGEYTKGMVDSFKMMIKEGGGISALFKGGLANYLRQISRWGMTYFGIDKLKGVVPFPFTEGLNKFASAIMLGLATSPIVIPFDVLKNRLQKSVITDPEIVARVGKPSVDSFADVLSVIREEICHSLGLSKGSKEYNEFVNSRQCYKEVYKKLLAGCVPKGLLNGVAAYCSYLVVDMLYKREALEEVYGDDEWFKHQKEDEHYASLKKEVQRVYKDEKAIDPKTGEEVSWWKVHGKDWYKAEYLTGEIVRSAEESCGFNPEYDAKLDRWISEGFATEVDGSFPHDFLVAMEAKFPDDVGGGHPSNDGETKAEFITYKEVKAAKNAARGGFFPDFGQKNLGGADFRKPNPVVVPVGVAKYSSVADIKTPESPVVNLLDGEEPYKSIGWTDRMAYNFAVGQCHFAPGV